MPVRDHWVDVRSGWGWATGAALEALTRFGPAAATAAPALHELAHRGWISAIKALWAVEGDNVATLAALRAQLTTASDSAVTDAVEFAGVIGPVAEPLVDLISQPSSTDNHQLRTCTAIALTRITGDFRTQEPQLRFVWHNNPQHRVDIANLVRDLGPAADSFLPNIRTEMTIARRHTYVENGWFTDAVTRDEELLKLCAEIGVPRTPPTV